MKTKKAVGFLDVVDQIRLVIAEWLMTAVWIIIPKGTREKESYRLAWDFYAQRTKTDLEKEHEQN